MWEREVRGQPSCHQTHFLCWLVSIRVQAPAWGLGGQVSIVAAVWSTSVSAEPRMVPGTQQKLNAYVIKESTNERVNVLCGSVCLCCGHATGRQALALISK